MNAAMRLLLSFVSVGSAMAVLPTRLKKRCRLNLESWRRRRLVGAKGLRP